MAEAGIGLASSAITLASLFTSCIECFHYFKSAQQCPEEAERLLVKLDCEKARLLTWGNTVGILHTRNEGRFSQLDEPENEKLIHRCMTQIIGLLTDGEKLQNEYGSRPATQGDGQNRIHVGLMSTNSMGIFRTAKRRFFARFGSAQGQPSLLSRTKWAIRDRAKFEGLILHLKDFIDSLIQMTPDQSQTIDEIVEEDIASIVGLRRLRLAESACEGSYPRWSAKASDIIRESEIGTIDRRNYEEIIRDNDDADVVASSVRSEEHGDRQEQQGEYTGWPCLSWINMMSRFAFECNKLGHERVRRAHWELSRY
jgi:hypothetical protein